MLTGLIYHKGGWVDTSQYSLARVALPPHRRDANMGRILHCLLVWHTGRVEHGLLWRCQLSLSPSVYPGCVYDVDDDDGDDSNDAV